MYKLENDPIYLDFKSYKKDKSDDTQASYRDTLKRFCEATGEPLHEVYKKMKEEQCDTIENNKIIKFNPNDITTYTKQYFDAFVDSLEKRGNNGRTINSRVNVLKLFFNKYGLDLPKWEEKPEDENKWQPLSTEDIAYVINDSSLAHKALFTFMLSTGMREGDVCNLKIRDFMEATQAMGYHNFVDVEEFIDKAPQNMIGFYDFYPKKTAGNHIRCMTFNTAESSNYILQNLRKIKNEYLPKKNKKDNLNIKISKDSALFGSRDSYFLSHLKPKSITNTCGKKNKKLREYHISKIDQQIKEGEISVEDREKKIEEIPIFHAHGLRKFFITTISHHGGRRVCEMLEGHKPEGNDKSYVHISKNDVEEVYEKAKYDLSIFDIDEDRIADNKAKELKEEIETIKKEKKATEEELQEANAKIEELEKQTTQEVADLKETVKQLSTRLIHLDNNEPLDVDKKQAINTFLMEKSKENNDNPTKLEEKLATLTRPEKIGLSHIAYELVEYDHNFENNDKYLSKIIKKALREWKRNPVLMEKVNAHHELINERERKWRLVQIKIDEKLASDGFWEDDEMDDIHEKILNYLRNNLKEFEQNEITDDYIDELIDKFA